MPALTILILVVVALVLVVSLGVALVVVIEVVFEILRRMLFVVFILMISLFSFNVSTIQYPFRTDISPAQLVFRCTVFFFPLFSPHIVSMGECFQFILKNILIKLRFRVYIHMLCLLDAFLQQRLIIKARLQPF